MEYCGFYGRADKELHELRTKYKQSGVPVIHQQGLDALMFFVAQKQPRTILEIGTAAGLSAAAMLQNCKGQLVGVEIDAKMAAQAQENLSAFNLETRASIVCADAKEFIENTTRQFDFIFLDGAKAQYKNYLPRLMQILNSGGVLFCDNVLFRGMVQGDILPPKKYRSIVNNLRIFLQMLKDQPNLTTIVLDIGDGVSVSIKE